MNSNTPAEGGRRARLAAERRALEGLSDQQLSQAQKPADAEVLDSRPVRRTPNPYSPGPVAEPSLFTQAERFWTEPPARPSGHSAPRTRRELAERSGRRKPAARTLAAITIMVRDLKSARRLARDYFLRNAL